MSRIHAYTPTCRHTERPAIRQAHRRHPYMLAGFCAHIHRCIHIILHIHACMHAYIQTHVHSRENQEEVGHGRASDQRLFRMEIEALRCGFDFEVRTLGLEVEGSSLGSPKPQDLKSDDRSSRAWNIITKTAAQVLTLILHRKPLLTSSKRNKELTCVSSEALICGSLGTLG